MGTIPASAIVNVIPGVLAAGGNALNMVGLMLTTSARVPIGQVKSFANPAAVGAYFGLSSQEYSAATTYFNAFTNSTQQPGSLLFAQFPQVAVPAYLQSGNIGSTYTLAQLNTIVAGTLSVVFNGWTYATAALNLGAASSYSNAASLIQTALNGALATVASITGTIAPATASVTGSISGSVLTVSTVLSGTLAPGSILTGIGVTAGTRVTGQLSGTTGGLGTYAVSVAQSVPSTTINATYGILTVVSTVSGAVAVGLVLSGSGVTSGTFVAGQAPTAGQWYVSPSQTVTPATAITGTAPSLVVTYDSTSGSFLITSGMAGAPSTAAYATGTLAATLLMTAATGAQLSQGADSPTPAAFMTALLGVTQNWATFMTLFDPDSANGNTQKLAFATWNGAQNNRFAYVCWDTDPAPTLSNSAPTSLGQLLKTNVISGTILGWDADMSFAPFACGWAASLDFASLNGRATLAFRNQSGIIPDVTGSTVAANLIANGYNFIGIYATANQSFTFAYPGSISGQFLWADSYIDQIWMNQQFQLALMVLLSNAKSIPYNASGYALIAAAMQDTIDAALNFGAIRAGVQLSSLQIQQVNSLAGAKIDDILSTQGWYLSIQPATPSVRQARQTPPMTFFYTDGQSVQQITLSSIELQ